MKNKPTAIFISIYLLLAGFFVALTIDAALSLPGDIPYVALLWGLLSLLLFTFAYLRINAVVEEGEEAKHDLMQVVSAVKHFRYPARS